MPELGKYAVEVALAYGVSLALLGGVVILSILQGRKVRRALDEAEARRKHD
jgi:heme exporter protein D